MLDALGDGERGRATRYEREGLTEKGGEFGSNFNGCSQMEKLGRGITWPRSNYDIRNERVGSRTRVSRDSLRIVKSSFRARVDGELQQYERSIEFEKSRRTISRTFMDSETFDDRCRSKYDGEMIRFRILIRKKSFSWIFFYFIFRHHLHKD